MGYYLYVARGYLGDLASSYGLTLISIKTHHEKRSGILADLVRLEC